MSTEPYVAVTTELANVVLNFAEATRAWPNHLLESPVWSWDDYEGVRYAHLHTAMTLRALAARIRIERAENGPLVTLAQHALADAHAACRTLQALLAPLSSALFDQSPAPGEYNLRDLLQHLNEDSCFFMATIQFALESEGGRLPTREEVVALIGDGQAALTHGTPAQAWAAFAATHARVLARFAVLTGTQVERPSIMWESTPYPILFRLYRFGAHLREHTIQAQKILAALGITPTEADHLARDLYAAVADVECARLGAGEVGREACAHTSEELAARFESLHTAWADVEHFVTAVESSNAGEVRRLLAIRPALAYTRMNPRHSALLYALYHGSNDIVDALVASGMGLWLHEAAALGATERIEKFLDGWPDPINWHAPDGFTPLQLACYFNRPAAARLLLARGADPHMQSRNAQALQAIHAAVAARNPEIVRLLIDAGADVTARQADGFTPLAAARKNGDAEIISLLQSAGATEEQNSHSTA